MTLLASLLLGLGVLLVVIAAIGVVRLPDMLCRAHAVSKALTLGISLMLLGAMFRHGPAEYPKFLLAILFQFLTIPVAGHLVSLIAYRKKFPRWHPPSRTIPPDR